MISKHSEHLEPKVPYRMFLERLVVSMVWARGSRHDSPLIFRTRSGSPIPRSDAQITFPRRAGETWSIWRWMADRKCRAGNSRGFAELERLRTRRSEVESRRESGLLGLEGLLGQWALPLLPHYSPHMSVALRDRRIDLRLCLLLAPHFDSRPVTGKSEILLPFYINEDRWTDEINLGVGKF